MSDKVISVTEFGAACLKLINQMNKDGEAVVITRHGHAAQCCLLRAVRPQSPGSLEPLREP